MRANLARAITAVAGCMVAVLIAAGCGSSSGSDDSSSTKSASPKLGLKVKHLCVVGSGKTAAYVASQDVEDLADILEDLVENAKIDGAEDIDDLTVSDYDGDLEPAQALATDLLVRHAVYEHEMTKQDLKLDKDAVDDQLDDLADDANLDDADDLLDRIDDATSLDEDFFRAAVQADLRKEELYDDLSKEDADEYDDADEYGDELVEQYDEKKRITCAKGVNWSEDIDPELEGDDDVEVDVEDLLSNTLLVAITGQTTTTGTTQTTPTSTTSDIDAELQAKRYDNAVKPLLSSTGAVVLRFTRSSQKLTGGSISINSLITAYKEQSADMKRINRLAARVTVQDGYLMKNHRTFRQAVGQMDKAISLMATIDKLRTEAAFDSRIKAVTAAVEESDRLFTKWHDGLGADPKGRDFPKIDGEWSRLTELLDAAS